MPRISASTVAEHRARQCADLLRAARTILLQEGAHAVTPAAVGRRIGLARTSVYKYFPSSTEILLRLAEDALSAWESRLRAAVEEAPDPHAAIEVFVRTSLEMAGDGEHRVAATVAAAGLPDSRLQKLGEAHERLFEPLREAVRQTGDPYPDITSTFVQGVLDGAVRLIDSGETAQSVTAHALAFLRHGVTRAATDVHINR